ncbi:MAG TPA: PIG-L deacetylase family protein [Candidatus Xenobia bacterium]|jgi:LmbE family N-acetylglucosaminyl deacetylase
MSDRLTRFLGGSTILIVAPHADDESIGCAGLALRAKAAGARVYLLVVSVGNLVRVQTDATLTTSSTRREELAAAARVLGADDWELLFEDEHRHLRLDEMPRRDLTAWVERDARLSIERVRPDVVLLPALSYNQDHEAVLRAGLVACRPHDPAAKCVPSQVWLYEYPPLSWNLPHEHFTPNVYIDISGCLDQKLDAYRCHASQVRAGVHQNSLQNVADLARIRGKEIGVEAAEAYQALRIHL